MAAAPQIRFTVVMPLYNKSAFIRRTLESVLAQDHASFEVVIVDDGSTDGSCDRIADLLSPSVRIVRQDNAGPGAARNRGFAEAAGEWVALIDADDLWRPNHLAVLATIIAACPASDVVATTSRHRHADAADDHPAPSAVGAIRQIDYFRDVGENVMHTSSIAIRRSAFLQTAGFGTFCPGEDEEFWARLALDHRFAVSDAVTSFYIRANDGIMDRHEQADRHDNETEASPTIAMLEQALRDPCYARRQDDIRGYITRIRLRDARIFLYRGKPRAARECLRSVAGGGLLSKAYWVLSRTPAPLSKRLIRLFSMAKKYLHA